MTSKRKQLKDEVIALYKKRVMRHPSPITEYSIGLATGLALGMSVHELAEWKQQLEVKEEQESRS